MKKCCLIAEVTSVVLLALLLCFVSRADEPAGDEIVTTRGKDVDGWTHLVLVKPLSYSVGHDRLIGLNERKRNLSIGGKQFDMALTAHATSTIKYRLSGKCRRLQFHYGLHTKSGGAAVFIVYADGKQIFKTGEIYGYGPTHAEGTEAPVVLDVTDVDVIELKALAVRGGAGAWSAWGDPKVK